MDKVLLYCIKEIMVYYRNNTTDIDLYNMTLELKDSIINHNCKTLFNWIKIKVPHIYTDSYILDYSPLDSNKIHWKIEKFICQSLDILLKAIEKREMELIYDISDMLQGIPNIEYWEIAKNMRYYWRDYVKPVKRKWNLYELDRYKPKYLSGYN